MKSFLNSILVLVSLGTAAWAQEATEAAEPSVAETTARSSLALGYREGSQAFLRQMRVGDFDGAAYLKGFLMGLENKPLTLEAEEVREAMTRLQKKISAREQVLAEKNRSEEERFLEANLTAEGITQTESGLQYRIVDSGTGEPIDIEVLEKSELTVSYRGTLPDGREFIASGEDTPEKLQLAEVIPGFREALMLMPEGAQFVVFIPSALAYGDQRHSGTVGPNQLLIFEITFLDFKEIPE